MNLDLFEQLNTNALVPASQQNSEVPFEIVPEESTTSVKPQSKLAAYLPASLLVIISSLAHGIGMFRYPYYENDEGTYISQAWSLITHGSLSPYTYWYDHAPTGWIFLGTWFKAVGGFFTFGSSVDTGRVFMLVLHAFSTLLLYSITRKLTKGKILPAFIAGLIFSLSPLAIYFQRRVLLDNMMVFWVLLALWTLLLPRLRLVYVTLSAIFFGIAVLTKETAIFFLPAFIYTAWVSLHKSHRMFGMSLWLVFSGLMVSLYPLYALLKTEFFPAGWFGNAPHVSLIETLKFQAGRGNGYHFWQTGSDFYKNLVEWFARDPFLILAGGIAITVGFVLAYKHKEFRIPLLFVLGMLWFLLRGGIIINFYILPFIPFLAMVISMVVEKLFEFIRAKTETNLIYNIGFATFGLLMIASMVQTSLPLFTIDETRPMKQATNWIKQNLPSSSVLIVDNAIFVDLRESRGAGDVAFPHAEWFWKVEKDPAVFSKNINGDWLNVDYVILSHEMVRQIADYQITLTKEVLPYTTLVTGWNSGGAFLDLNKFISTNGDWMRVYKVDSRQDYVLKSLWKEKTSTEIKSYGQIVEQLWNTTANDQGEALLEAVIAGDKQGFDGLWSWTRDHLQHRPKDLLVSNNWKVGIRGSSVDQYDATLEANQDIALALILAGRKWSNVSYTEMATHIVQDLWTTFAVTASNRTILTATTKKDLSGNYFVDPTVFAPATYRVFATVDPAHPWQTLASESYVDLPSLNSKSYTTFTLSKEGSIYAHSNVDMPVEKIVSHVALDAKLFASPESLYWLNQNAYAISEQAKSGSAKSRAALLMSLEVTNPDTASSFYDNTLATYFSRKTNTWQQTLTPEEQNSLWMAFAIGSIGGDFSKLARGTSVKKLITLNTN